MKNIIMLFVVLVFTVAGCANNEIDMVSEFEDDGFEVESDSDFLVDGEDQEKELSFDTPKDEEDIEKIVDMPITAESAVMEPEETFEKYQVEENDTLMLIAFKLFGDYRQWRNLQEWNPRLDGTNLEGIREISYKKNSARFVWKTKGNPYLIKRGNTLGTISSNVYGVSKRWREIYSNNREMIHDPNLIFVGFTLYYIPDRSLASE